MSAAGTRAPTRLPHPALRALVTVYRGYRYDAFPTSVHHGLPGAEITVVLAFGAPLDVGRFGDEASRGRHWFLVSGLHTAPAAIYQTGPQEGIQLGLTPMGARVLLGMPAGGLGSATVSGLDVLGDAAERMYGEVAAAPTWENRFTALDAQLLGRARDVPSVRGELSWAWSSIQQRHGAIRVDRVASELGWSRRHLTSRFRVEFGLTPKQASQVARVQFVRSRLLVGDASLADVAHEAGYADQAHLTREWRALAGCTPTRWLRAEMPFLQDRAAAE